MERKIKELTENGESQKLEFKLKLEQSLGKSICSFANTNDGIILIGVSDTGEIIGTRRIDEQKIANTAHTCKPSVYPEIEKINVDDKIIFLVKIKKSDQIHSFKNVAYKRVGSHNKPLSPEEVVEFAKSTGRIRFDEQICEGVVLEDVDNKKVEWFLKRAKYERNFDVEAETPVKEALERLELMKKGKLTNAAVLLFGKNPQKPFLQAETRCARFKGTEPTKPFLDMKIFSGSIIDQVDKALSFVLEHIPMAAWLVPGRPEREEKYEYPPDAIREAIINAICHRDYSIPSNVQIRIFDDRLEVWGVGPLPEPLTPEDLKKKHKSILRNPLIGKCFFLIKYIEEWGTGTNEIIKECLDWELPEPEFELVAGGLVITFWKSRLTEELMEGLGLNRRQKSAIEFLKEQKRITRLDYEKNFNASERTANRELSELVNLGILKKEGKGPAIYYTLSEISPNLAKSRQTRRGGIQTPHKRLKGGCRMNDIKCSNCGKRQAVKPGETYE